MKILLVIIMTFLSYSIYAQYETEILANSDSLREIIVVEPILEMEKYSESFPTEVEVILIPPPDPTYNTGSSQNAIAVPTKNIRENEHEIKLQESKLIGEAKKWVDTIYTSDVKTSNAFLVEPFSKTKISSRPIKSESEIYYMLENEGKDTIREDGDGWNTRTEYDKMGRYDKLYVIFEDSKTGKDSAYFTTQYHYKDDKIILKEHFEYSNGAKTGLQEYVYDNYGKLIREYYRSMNHDGTELLAEGRGSRYLYKYHTVDSITKEEYDYSPADRSFVLFKISQIRTDFKGRIISEKRRDVNDETVNYSMELRYIGDSVIVKDWDTYGNKSTHTIFYNNKNDAIKYISSGYEWESELSYDKYNNWTSAIETQYAKETRRYFIKRQIEYYKN